MCRDDDDDDVEILMFSVFQVVPFNMNFPRGVYDKLMLTIRGQIKPDAKM